jgi:alpha-amylase
MMQFFHWYTPPNGNLGNELRDRAPELSAKGITALWLLPAYKDSSGGYDVGYSVYDLYDLGEFDQRGTLPTKYGTKDEYLKAIEGRYSPCKSLSLWWGFGLSHWPMC